MTTIRGALTGQRGVSERLRSSPRLLHALPFAVVAVAGQLSALLDPTNMVYFWMAALGLVLAAGVLALPERRFTVCGAAALYAGSVAALMVANGGVVTSGLGALFFLAVVGVALYGGRGDSVVVVALVLGFLLVVTLDSPHTAAVTERRLVFLGAIATVLSISIHALRVRLEASNKRTTGLLHQAEAMNAAAQQLAQLRDPESIAAVGVELAAQVASVPGGRASEAWYVGVRDDARRIIGHWGAPGSSAFTGPSLLTAGSRIAEVSRTHQPISRELRSATPKGVLRETCVPVFVGSELHGVLDVVMADSTSKAAQTGDGCMEQLSALAHLMGMALANWAAHEELEYQATAEERRRVARDLHDGLAHELAFIASKARRNGAPPEVKELSGAADRALDEARRAITVLSSREPQSLRDALTQTSEDLGARLGVPVLVDLDDHVAVDPEVAEQLLRIVREGLVNAAVHGEPTFVTLQLRDEGVRNRLVIADDGRGFDPVAVDATHFGLVSMRERAASFGGLFSVNSSPGHGTRLDVTFR